MKTPFLLLAGLLISTASFAQPAFTLATLNEMGEEYKTDSKAFFTSRLSDDFRYTTTKGVYQTRKDIIAGDPQKILKTEYAEPVIFQSGNLAVVSGIHKVERVGPDGSPVMGQVACTYTFQRRQNKWMFVASQQTAIANPPAQGEGQAGSVGIDEAAIRTVLEGHTQASMNRDAEKAVSYFANSPNVAVTYDAPGYPRGYDVVADGYRKLLGSMAKSDEKLSTSDYRYRIVGNTAFVTCREIYTKPDGTVSAMHKANYLEKEGSQWKMIGNFWMPEQKAK
ncbi:MAG: DUF4440 domain-containing protein [Bacteroidetes bacterium]|nr:DUF4440 domain-containing protein [Fibrella sp.]